MAQVAAVINGHPTDIHPHLALSLGLKGFLLIGHAVKNPDHDGLRKSLLSRLSTILLLFFPTKGSNQRYEDTGDQGRDHDPLLGLDYLLEHLGCPVAHGNNQTSPRPQLFDKV
jgi:hypothetical protein